MAAMRSTWCSGRLRRRRPRTELTSVDAAPLCCAGLTPYRALKISGLRVGETVAIWGVGGLGHYAVQIAKPWVRV